MVVPKLLTTTTDETTHAKRHYIMSKHSTCDFITEHHCCKLQATWSRTTVDHGSRAHGSPCRSTPPAEQAISG